MATSATPEPSRTTPAWATEALLLLARVGRALGVSLDYHTTLRQLSELLVPQLAERCVVSLSGADGRMMPLAGNPSEALSALMSDVASAGRSRTEPPVAGAAALADVARQAALRGDGIESLLVVPLNGRDGTVGVLALVRGAGSAAYTDADLALAEEIAARAGVAVDHGRLYLAEQQARAAAETAAEAAAMLHGYTSHLYRMVEALSDVETVEGAARLISEQGAAACGALGCYVALLSEDATVLDVLVGAGPGGHAPMAFTPFPLEAQLPASEAVRTGAAVFVGSVSERRARYPAAVSAQDELGYVASAALPLVADGRVLGCVGFVFAEERAFPPPEREFMQAVARHCAVALARLATRTELGRAHRGLAAERERLRQVLAAARMGTWHWDVAQNRLTWDDNLTALYGLRPGGAPTDYAGFMALVHPEDRQYVDLTVRRAVQAGIPLDYQFRIVDPEGRVRWIADQGRVFPDANGAPLYLAGVCTDVTERKRAEDQLREAQKLDAVGRLAGGMAHEINNMMTVVLGFCEFLLKDSKLPPDGLDDVREIRHAAERAAGITRQVLAFSRQQIMQSEPLDLNAIVGDTETMLRRLLETPVEIVTRLTPGLPPIQGDRNHLGQVLVNLALNARDAMPNGGRLTIATETSRLSDPDLVDHDGTPVPPGEYVALRISDTGVGMDPLTVGRVFEPFFTTKPVGQGTGLGLSTVYGIVKQSHGFIWVTTEPGEGSTFTVAFPRSHVPVGSGSRATEPRLTPVQGGERILVVEDEPLVGSVTCRALEMMGYTVERADDGDAAISRISREDLPRVDLVLTDIMMPRIGGPELGRRLRLSDPNLPVLFMSGHPSEEMIHRGLLGGGEHFIQKPFRPETLADRVRGVLDGRAAVESRRSKVERP